MDAPTFQLEKPTADYTMVCNALLRDRAISLRAKGLYALMFSKPDGWIFHEAALLQESSEGRDALRSAMKELLVRGWVQKRRPRDGGKFTGVMYRMMLTTDWKTVGGLTGDGKSTTNNTDNSNTDKPTPQPPKGEPDGFDEIWKACWKRGEATNPRQPALKAYLAALKRGAKHEDILAGVKARIGVDKPDTVYAPQLATWLNQERWKDGAAGGGMSATELEAASKRLDESIRRRDEELRQLALKRSEELLGVRHV